MLIVNPEERVNITDVVKYCEQQIQIYEKRDVKNNSALTTKDSEQDSTPQKKKNFIDPCLIMDDIAEKLVLLDYEKKFCATRKHKQVS